MLAVDPSSPFTGGAILGDRVRMQDHATDPGVFIRSMSTRGHLGGLSAATPAGRTGAGRRRLRRRPGRDGRRRARPRSRSPRLADTTLVLLAPGMGDAIQAVKAGILEVADVFVVNKADRDGADADRTRHPGHARARRAASEPGEWRPPVVRRVAARGEGIDDVLAALAKHRAGWQHDRRGQRRGGPGGGRGRGDRAGHAAGPDRRLHGTAALTLAAEVAAGRLDPYAAAATLVETLTT